MGDSTITHLAEQEALEEIVETVMQADKGEAPFALVLGSGFSRGLVPTARELVTESLPLWMNCRNEKTAFEDQTQVAAERAVIARSFWKGFVEGNVGRGIVLKLDAATGLPEDNGEAYRAAFSPRYRRAVGAPAEARKFQRALMQLNKPRLNAAHFLLASLLGVQPGKTRESNLFRAQAAFSRLILTTNFDPFLQTALQAVNRLYFMSDTPELGVSDEIFDDQTDAIHLVYLHGSIHRRSQAATDDEIRKLKEKNARTLAPVLKRRGVIVLGYSGWDDAIVAALAACDGFDYRLYWCGLESDPLAKGAFGAGVEDILRKHSAVYVQSAGAGNFMAQLCRLLVNGNPRLLDNPIGQLRDLLDSIDLKELEELKQVVSEDPTGLIQSTNAATTLVAAKRLTIERLTEAEQIFLGKILGSAPAETTPSNLPLGRTEDPNSRVAPPESNATLQQIVSSAQLSLTLGNYEEVLKRSSEALSLTDLAVADQIQPLGLRANAYYVLGRSPEAIDDLSKIIDLADVPVEHETEALMNRAFVLLNQGDPQKAIADYTRIIELADAPVEQVTKALYNRGVALGQKGDRESAIADYTRVIEQMPPAPVGQVARALNNRGIALGEKNEWQKAVADYTLVIEQLPDAPIEQVAKALINRGVAWSKLGHLEKEIADYTQVIDRSDSPVTQVAVALNNRGIAWRRKGERDKALADYIRVIEQLPNVPVDQLAQALNNRGALWSNKGDLERALADHTRVIEQLAQVPADQMALALTNRGWVRYLMNNFVGFLSDTEAALVIESLEAQKAAAFNLGLALLALDRDAEAQAAYREAGERLPESIEMFGLADLREANQKWLSSERAQPVIQLLESLKK